MHAPNAILGFDMCWNILWNHSPIYVIMYNIIIISFGHISEPCIDITNRDFILHSTLQKGAVLLPAEYLELFVSACQAHMPVYISTCIKIDL